MPESPPIEDQIIAAIRRIIRAVDLRSRQLVELHGLSTPQIVTLREIARRGSVTAGGLAKAVHLSQPTMTGILDRLERRGLIERPRALEDRRSLVVRITQAGIELLDSAPSPLQDRFRAELARLEDWEQNMLLATLQRIASMMQDGHSPEQEVREVSAQSPPAGAPPPGAESVPVL